MSKNRSTIFSEITRSRRYHRSPRKLMAAIRAQHAEALSAQCGEFRNARRQARYDARNRDDLDMLLPPTHPRGQHALHLLSEGLIP